MLSAQINAMNMLNLTNAIVPITRFNKGEAGKIIDEVKNEGPRIIVKNNVPECVMISLEEYNRLCDAANRTITLDTSKEAEKKRKAWVKKIRENAYAYIHGHEVGGTNPSLLEAMASTKLNLVLDVPFNREVADKSALYWTKEKNNLKEILSLAESLSEEDQRTNGIKAITIIKKKYNWNKISGDYKSLFCQ